MSVKSMRQRMLDVVRLRSPDRVPFVQYSGLAAPDEEIWASIGRESMGILRWVQVHRFEAPNCEWRSEDIRLDGKHGIRRELRTPAGMLTEERLYEPAFGTTAAHTHLVKELEDYRVFLSYLRDLQVCLDLQDYRKATDLLGDNGLPHTYVLRSPYQQLWVEWVDIQDLAGHMMLHPEVMEEVFAEMRKVEFRVFKVLKEALQEVEIPYVVVPDNITASMIGPKYFREHCAPAYEALANIIADTGKDVPIYVHMDGDLKPLWEEITETPVRGLDSMSPPPDNDTSVADALSQWPDMRVCINYPSSVHLQPPEQVYDKTLEILGEGGRSGRLQIQISENVPPNKWRVSFPAIASAIDDFFR